MENMAILTPPAASFAALAQEALNPSPKMNPVTTKAPGVGKRVRRPNKIHASLLDAYRTHKWDRLTRTAIRKAIGH